MCRRLAGNDADALDATQEALIAIARGLRRFDGRAAFSTWAYRVATNACLDELRRRKRRAVPGLPDDLGAGRGRAPPPAVAHRGPPRPPGDRRRPGELPEEFRAPVVLRDLCDLDYAEIAEALGHPARHGPLAHRPRPGAARPPPRRRGTSPTAPGRPTSADDPPTTP